MKDCPQTKCIFNQMGGCKNCEVCNAEPNIINEDCDRCWNCAYDEGVLRWDDNKETETEKNKILEIADSDFEKPMEIKAK